MHEMGIAMEVVRIAVDSIPSEMAASKIKVIHLKVGRLSAVVPRSLEFCFEMAAKETPAEGARLAIEEVAVVARCNGCRHQWEISEPAFNCPQCHGSDTEMLSGRELDIEAIELAEEQDQDV